MTIDVTIGFIGGGNMAKAIAKGIITKGTANFLEKYSLSSTGPKLRGLEGILKSSQIIVSSPSETTINSWKSLFVETTISNADVIIKSDIIILAFKPHQLGCALNGVFKKFTEPLPSKLFVSVLAGVSCEVLYETLIKNVQENPRLIRVMPSTLSMICEGCSAIVHHDSAQPNDIKIIKEIFMALGQCEVIPEYLIPAVTGLSGSGPAYIYMVIEALSDGGVKQGLSRNLATTFAAQTVLGAAKMVLDTKKHPSELKDEVCSAGGTTIHAVHALEKGGLRATLMNAVEAAALRAIEMGHLNK